MMRNNKMRDCLHEGRYTLGTRVWSQWPFFIEMLGDTGNFDYIEFVAEYAPFTQYDLENMARACELFNMSSMIKVDFQNHAYVAQKAVAAGFQAVLFTDMKTPEEVREAVRVMKGDSIISGGRFGYPNRRFIGYQPYLSQMDHVKRLDEIVLAFMIEKKEAVENLEEICSIPGVDMLQFGPSDFSMSNGKNSTDNKEACTIAHEKMIRTALKHGIRPRVEIYGDPSDAKKYLEMGVKDICFGDQMKIYSKFASCDGRCMNQIISEYWA